MKEKINNLKKILQSGLIILLILMSYKVMSQSNSLVLKGDGSTKSYLVLNNGTQTTPIYLVVNNSNTTAIARTGTDAGWIISENEFNIVRWNMGTATGTYTVPFGATTGSEADEYIPLVFTKSSSGSSDISFATYGTGADNTTYPTDVSGMTGIYGGSATDNLLDRYYFIDASDATTAEIIFAYRGSENATTSEPTELVSPQQWDNASSQWLVAIGSGASGVTTGCGNVPSGSTSSFSSSKVWGLSHNGNPLPIQLIRFDAMCSGQQVNLAWSTATETNNSGFIVQRSIDAINFADIISVQGAGNSNTMQNYLATDNSPLNTQAYYRLKQTDFDGNYSYSSMVAVESCLTPSTSCNTFYNPEKGSITVSFTGEDNLPFSISLFDMLGQQVVVETPKQTGPADLKVNYLPHGIYLVVVRTDREAFSTKVYLNR